MASKGAAIAGTVAAGVADLSVRVANSIVKRMASTDYAKCALAGLLGHGPAWPFRSSSGAGVVHAGWPSITLMHVVAARHTKKLAAVGAPVSCSSLPAFCLHFCHILCPACACPSASPAQVPRR